MFDGDDNGYDIGDNSGDNNGDDNGDKNDDDNGDNNDYVSGSVSAVLPPSLLVFCTVIYIQLSVVLFFVIYLGNKHPPLDGLVFL